VSARRKDSPTLAAYKRLARADLRVVRLGDPPRKPPSPQLWDGLAAMQSIAVGYEASRGPLAPVFTLQELRRIRNRRLRAERAARAEAAS
jgi:hypothetical protein